MDLTTFDLLLGVATLTCALVAGLLGSFAIIVMPGIGRLDDRDYLRAFAVIDAVIQRNQPVFIVTWAGSVLSLVAATVVGVTTTGGAASLLLLAASVLYIVGVQAPTMAVNVPLNNRLQATDLDTASTTTIAGLRSAFDGRWNRWNRRRSGVALLVVVLLLLTNHVA